MKNTTKLDYLLGHITTLLARNIDQILLEQMGVSYSQYKILRILKGNVAVKQLFIAEVLGQTEASISRQVSNLLTIGYITKTKDERNKRIRLIKITPKGLTIEDACTNILDKYLLTSLSKIDNKKQDLILDNIEELHKNICNFDHEIVPNYMDYLVNN